MWASSRLVGVFRFNPSSIVGVTHAFKVHQVWGWGRCRRALLILAPLVAFGLSPASAAGPYTAIVVNNQFPTSNSITEVNGSGASWTPETPVVVGSGDEGLTTIAYSPDGSTAYLAVGNENSIFPIKTSTLDRWDRVLGGGYDAFGRRGYAERTVLGRGRGGE